MTDVTRLTLTNGLQVLLKEIHTAPLISTWMWYRVGSKDEPTGRTGISHWVEHMQFKGTPTFPASVLDKAIAREGGVWNAFTYFDWTTYFETLPAEKADLGLRLEADRIVNSVFDPAEVESERTVIISEREGDENEPLFLLGESVQSAAFRVHPYRHEVIGDKADLRTITRDDLHQHYRSYYVPNNAVLAVGGDFETGAMLGRIRELFEGLAAGPTPARLTRPEPAMRGEVRLDLEGPGETTYIQISYRAPAASQDDFFALAVLDSLLAGPSSPSVFGGGGISNKTSRLYRRLVEKQLAIGVHGDAQATIDPFLYTLILTVHPERTAAEVLAALDREIEQVQSKPVTAGEVARAIKQARALFAYGSENITSQAAWLGFAEMFATYDWFTAYLDRLAAVTREDVRRAAQTVLAGNNRIVGIYRPNGAEKHGVKP